MPLITLSDRTLAGIDRRLDDNAFPSPDEIRSMICEIRKLRPAVAALSASHMRALAALQTVQLTVNTTLQMEASS